MCACVCVDEEDLSWCFEPFMVRVEGEPPIVLVLVKVVHVVKVDLCFFSEWLPSL